MTHTPKLTLPNDEEIELYFNGDDCPYESAKWMRAIAEKIIKKKDSQLNNVIALNDLYVQGLKEKDERYEHAMIELRSYDQLLDKMNEKLKIATDTLNQLASGGSQVAFTALKQMENLDK